MRGRSDRSESAADSVETVGAILRALARLIDTYGVPTQSCCLAHITSQLAALKQGAPVDLLFQSIAGTEDANRSFGVTLQMLREGREQVIEHHSQRDVAWKGSNVMYFETGQGSALSAGAHHGADQLTLEARAYGVARVFQPFLVNSVVGFIGPEYLYDERQSSAPDSKITSWANCLAFRWAVTSATRITRQPIRTRPTICFCSWPPRAVIILWASRARMT